VVSPSDLYTEVSEKVPEWLQAGAKMVVVVNPRTRQVLVHLSPIVVTVLGVGDTLEGRGGAGVAATPSGAVRGLAHRLRLQS
jgi:hypothetical protein